MGSKRPSLYLLDSLLQEILPPTMSLPSRCMAVVRPHVPSIQFRAGGSRRLGQHGREEMTVVPVTEIKTGSHSASLEWWQMPERFRRSLLDQAECEEINSGGGGKVWN